MIFAHTWQWILAPSPATGAVKTQTRRIVKAGEYLGRMYNTLDTCVAMRNGKHKWVVSADYSYAVQPGRGKPAIWWRDLSDIGDDENTPCTRTIEYAHVKPAPDGHESFYDYTGGKAHILTDSHFEQLRIRITNIRQEDVRKITNEDARAEGFLSIYEFLDCWAKMHDKTAYKLSHSTDMSDGDEYGISSHMEEWVSYLKGQRPANLYRAWALTFEVVK